MNSPGATNNDVAAVVHAAGPIVNQLVAESIRNRRAATDLIARMDPEDPAMPAMIARVTRLEQDVERLSAQMHRTVQGVTRRVNILEQRQQQRLQQTLAQYNAERAARNLPPQTWREAVQAAEADRKEEKHFRAVNAERTKRGLAVLTTEGYKRAMTHTRALVQRDETNLGRLNAHRSARGQPPIDKAWFMKQMRNVRAVKNANGGKLPISKEAMEKIKKAYSAAWQNAHRASAAGSKFVLKVVPKEN